MTTTVLSSAYSLSLGNKTLSGQDIADDNAIRYRSYYYDVETGLYYLKSRYYDPDYGM